MKPAITDNVALVLCFSVCLSLLPLNAFGQQNLVAQACEKARYKDVCLSSLKAEYATRDASDLDTIALIAIKAASNNGSHTSVYIKRILDTHTHLEPAVEQTFDDCSENYISAMQQLDDSLSALVSKNYKDAKVWLEAALTDATTCDTGLKEGPGNELELVNRNTIFLQLCSNALDIMTLLATSAPPASRDNSTVESAAEATAPTPS